MKKKRDSLLAFFFDRGLFPLIVILLIHGSAAAQDPAGSALDKRVSLTVVNKKVKTALEMLESQAGIKLNYSSKSIDVNKVVSFSCKNMKVKEVLDTFFKPIGIAYKLVGGHIVLYESPQESNAAVTGETQLNTDMELKGVVTNEGSQPIAGVSATMVGSSYGTTTDAKGHFTIHRPGVSFPVLLSFSYVGYSEEKVTAADAQPINVVLKENASRLNDVVVVGYGTQKKLNLTGAVASIKMDDVLGDRPVTSVGSALQGAIPGLTVSGAASPGASKAINIRGMTSINGGSPLILVDNVVTTNLDLVNPEDIETVSVLKDASSAAIYGARAAFGVVIITTKHGKRNQKIRLDYSGNFAFQKANNIPAKATPLQEVQGYKDIGYVAYWSGQNVDRWLDLIKQYNVDPGKFPASGWVLGDDGYRYFLRSNNEIKDMTSGAASKLTNNLSASGGSENTNYRISFGNTSEDGILITNKDSYKRTNVSGYVNTVINKWISTALDVRYAQGRRTMPKTAGEFDIWQTGHPSYYPNDSLPYNGVMYPVNTSANIIRNSDVQSWVDKNTRVFSHTELSFAPGLKGIFEYTYENNHQDNQYYNNLFYLQRGVENALDPSDQNTTDYYAKNDINYQSLNAYLTLEKSLGGGHGIKVVAGINQERSTADSLWAQNTNMISNQFPSITGGTGIIKAGNGYSEYKLFGAFYRANYSYKDKYLFEADGRYDGSSKFPTSHRFGYFPSFSAGWVVSKEAFMSGVKKWLDLFKVRGSYGALGNQAIANYQYYSVMNPYKPYWINNGLQPTSLTSPGLVSANFTWEKVNTLNFGMDMAFLRNRLFITADWYQRNTIGMLSKGADFPAVVGASAPLQNAANLQTKGWELTLQWRDRIGSDWRYNVGVNVYDSKSIITKFNNDAKVLGNYYVGMTIGEIWGYVSDGFYTANDFAGNGSLKGDVVSIQGVLSHEGDIKFRNLRNDANSQNQIDIGEGTVNNPGDQKIIGNNSPRFNYGLTGTIGWKNFDLSILLQGVAKMDAWVGGDIMFPHSGKFSSFYANQLNYWTPTHTNAYFGRMYVDAGESQSSNQRVQTKFLQNAAYLRLKNATISYTMPRSFFNNMPFTGAKVFFSGENMFTFSKLIKGVDPELLSWQYPQMSTYSFGLNVNF